jgi:alkylresorcinol/alkylpyrone synthase
MKIASVGCALPRHYYSQEVLSEALKKEWAKRHHNLERLDALHKNVLVGGRHLALPLEEYPKLDSFTQSNDAFLRVAVDLGAEAAEEALKGAGIAAADIGSVFFVSTTGIATPSIDARIANRVAFRRDVKRSPLFGLGCVGGAAGIARACDYVHAYPDQHALVISVELCSLTLQRQDLSIPNIIASGLFGDAAAAVVIAGANCKAAGPGPKVLASRSVFYRDTERVMGWDVTSDGLKVVLSAEIPNLVRREIRADVDSLLESQGVSLDDITTFVCHPGGPRVLEAFAEALSVPSEAFRVTWESLRSVGNLSSASVLFVLRETMARRPAPEGLGLLMAMGPGFCSELVLLEW